MLPKHADFGSFQCPWKSVLLLITAHCLLITSSAPAADLFGSEVKLSALDGTTNDNFGISVSAAGDVALVGADHDDGAGTNSGSAYVFEQFFPVPEPAVSDMYLDGSDVVVAWTSAAPVDYTLQASDAMEDGAAWSNVTGCVDMPGQDGTMTVTNALDSNEKRFFRINAVNSPIR